MPAGMSVHHVCAASQEGRRACQRPWKLELRTVVGHPVAAAESNLGPLEEKPVL